VRQGGSERERAGERVRGQAALLGHGRGVGRAWARARGRASGPLGWAGPEGEKESARVRFMFFFFKILNSDTICLFH
jgi:hypothetical protein